MNKGFFLNYADIACLHGFLLMGRGIVGREGGRDGGMDGGRYSVLSVFTAISCGEIVM